MTGAQSWPGVRGRLPGSGQVGVSGRGKWEGITERALRWQEGSNVIQVGSAEAFLRVGGKGHCRKGHRL